MVTISDEFPEVAKAAQAARILEFMGKASSFVVHSPQTRQRVLSTWPKPPEGWTWSVLCDGEWFFGQTLADALAQCAQWLEAREVQ